MRFLDYLNEEYLARSGPYEIFKNPSKKEILSIKKGYVRYIADFKKKDLYVWDYRHIHSFVMPSLTIYRIYQDRPLDFSDPNKRNFERLAKSEFYQYYSIGTAKVLRDGRLEFYRSDELRAWVTNKKFGLLKWSSMNDNWLNKWFVKPYTKSFKQGSMENREWK